ncbi:hypothetical protein NMY22_g3336 [Coprinellus aureogranulatus]|nr:hypothetical protein NMY22_g3336 [Coprinellus aureogranulatus]
MSAAAPTNRKAENPFRRIVRQLCSSRLNPIVALRKRRTQASPSEQPCDVSRDRQALQTSIVALDVAFSIAETIPVFGTPLKGALEAMCKVLRLVEVPDCGRPRGINVKADRTDGEPGMRGRDTRLPSTEVDQRKIECMLRKSWVRSPAIARLLAECHDDINSYLLDFLALRSAVPASERLSTECITVIDPFGASQPILRVDMSDIEVIERIILSRYNFNPPLKQMLYQFVHVRMYELTMNNGHEITALTVQLLSSIGKGSTVVMNIIIFKHIVTMEQLRCPLCHGPMFVSLGERTSCDACDRRTSAVSSTLEIGEPSEGQTSGLALFRHVTVKYAEDGHEEARIEEVNVSKHEEQETPQQNTQDAAVLEHARAELNTANQSTFDPPAPQQSTQDSAALEHARTESNTATRAASGPLAPQRNRGFPPHPSALVTAFSDLDPVPAYPFPDARTELNAAIQAAFGPYATFECQDGYEMCRNSHGQIVNLWRSTIIVNADSKKYVLANACHSDRETGQNMACTLAIYELDRQFPTLSIFAHILRKPSATDRRVQFVKAEVAIGRKAIGQRAANPSKTVVVAYTDELQSQ